MALSSAKVFRRWLSRASAFSRCARALVRAACSANSFAAVPKLNPSTNAAAAVRTWHTVSSGFFPPKLVSNFGKYQKAYRTDDLVALQSEVTATFPVVKAQLRLTVFKAPLEVPAIIPSKSAVGWPGSP
jgi:hypothetical protein